MMAQAADPNWEVVRVHRPFRLIDAESYERWYRQDGNRELPKGFYAVTWRGSDGTRRFDENACFVGPFGARAEAEAVAERGQHRAQGTVFSQPGPRSSGCTNAP